MASDTSLMDEDDFLCSICLVVFTRPVSIPCGHNFCHNCITNYWDTLTAVKCPLCNDVFPTRPMLKVNTFIAEITAKFKKHVQGKSSDPREQTGKGTVLCDLCTGAKLTAVKSCLVCVLSYCQTHVELHQKTCALKKHKPHPIENLANRICKNHSKPLKTFCRTDQVFLCQLCEEQGHATHWLVTLEEEAQMRRMQLGIEKKEVDQMVQVHAQMIVKIQNSMEASRYDAEAALSCSLHVMSGLVDYIRRSLVELTEVIETKKKKNETKAHDLINELEREIMLMKLKNLQLNTVSLSEDPFTFLENVFSFTYKLPKMKNWADMTPLNDQFTIQEAMARLETAITTEISVLCDPDFKEKQWHAVDVTLDPDTANPYLTISGDGKEVAHVDQMRTVLNKPEMFDEFLNVLTKEGFSSGKFYYEVQVKDKTQWDLGVASESINRKGQIRLAPVNGYWTIWLRKGCELTANAGPPIGLRMREVPQKIGVFVDYEGGRVSFYDVDNRAKIFTFTGCTFTEKLFPFFSPSANDGGRNSAPLIITPVKRRR